MRYFNTVSVHSSTHFRLASASSTWLFLSVCKLYILVSSSILKSFLAGIYTVLVPSFLNHLHLLDRSFTFHHNCQSFSEHFISFIFYLIYVCVCIYRFQKDVCGLPTFFLEFQDFKFQIFLYLTDAFSLFQLTYPIVYLIQILAYFPNSNLISASKIDFLYPSLSNIYYVVS